MFQRNDLKKFRSSLLALTLGLSITACGDNDPDPARGVTDPAFALSTLIFNADQSSLYVMLIDSLENPNVALARAREFPGSADMWVHNGFVYVANSEDLSVTKFDIEDGALDARGRVSFSSFGLSSVGFWNNTFVAPDKAYMSNGASAYVVWNPDVMEIAGTIELNAWNPPRGFEVKHSFHDRGSVIRDGKLYHPFYVSDESFYLHQMTSFIAVIDIETDSVDEVLSAPCPGLDFVTRDEDDNLYFSSWVFAAGGATVLQQPETCISRLPAGSNTLETWSSFKNLTGGLEGAALYYVGDGTGVMTALDPSHFTGDAQDAAAVTSGVNWRLWSVDFQTKSASVIEEIDWNTGAHYSWPVGRDDIMLLGDFATTTAYRHAQSSHQTPTELFEVTGWAIRIFDLP